jgi:hypothetical protein
MCMVVRLGRCVGLWYSCCLGRHTCTILLAQLVHAEAPIACDVVLRVAASVSAADGCVVWQTLSAVAPSWRAWLWQPTMLAVRLLQAMHACTQCIVTQVCVTFVDKRMGILSTSLPGC